MNVKIKNIAKFFRLPILDVYELLGTNISINRWRCTINLLCDDDFTGENEAIYLQDKHHQSAPFSKLIAASIAQNNWTVPDDCSCQSICPT